MVFTYVSVACAALAMAPSDATPQPVSDHTGQNELSITDNVAPPFAFSGCPRGVKAKYKRSDIKVKIRHGMKMRYEFTLVQKKTGRIVDEITVDHKGGKLKVRFRDVSCEDGPYKVIAVPVEELNCTSSSKVKGVCR